MKKLLITISLLLLLSTPVYAGKCLPYSICEALKSKGQPCNYLLIDKELGNKKGYYPDKALKKLKVDFKKVDKITEFPVIVEIYGHVFTIIGQIGKYYKVQDINDGYTFYKKSWVTGKHLNYYQISAK